MKITQVDRSFGTDRVMVSGSDVIQLRHLQGKRYSEVKDAILKLSDGNTKFYHRIPHADPNQSIKVVEVSKEVW